MGTCADTRVVLGVMVFVDVESAICASLEGLRVTFPLVLLLLVLPFVFVLGTGGMRSWTSNRIVAVESYCTTIRVL